MKEKQLNETRKPQPTAILVGIRLPDTPTWEPEYSLNELEALVDTARLKTLDKILQARRTIDPATFIGTGKVNEILMQVEALDADFVIFDTELSPAQLKNLEKILKKPTLDRSDVILNIFAERAQTKEAKLQVELAQMKYSLPRLKRLWSHLERQQGGQGIRGGMGEKQIEVDRRIVRKKINRLERELKQIDKQRKFRRRNRDHELTPTIALVGYTNVGKSSLFNRISQSEVFVENRLFATLDSTVRNVEMPQNTHCLMVDTVGFIRKLPHHLVASFRSTLQEAAEADLLLHVIDVSSPILSEEISAVEDVLSQLEIDDINTIFVLNKIDKVEENMDLQAIWDLIPQDIPYVMVSAKTGENIDLLKDLISETISQDYLEETFWLPMNQSREIAELHRIGTILKKEYHEPDKVEVICKAHPKQLARFKKFLPPAS